MLFVRLLLLFLFVVQNSFAQPSPTPLVSPVREIEVIVESTRTGSLLAAEPTLTLELSDTSTPLSATLYDVVRRDAGLQVSRSGGLGQLSSLFIRGSGSEHVLVLLDGAEINDPSSPNGGFDFSNLDLANIDSVEIFKGPQSLRFGAGALGGVINIRTKRGTGRATPFLQLKGGSYETLHATTGARGATGALSYSFALSRFQTQGISAADDDEGYSELDAHRFHSFSSRLGYALSDATELELITRYLTSETELDYSILPVAPYSVTPDDPNYRAKAAGLTDVLLASTEWNEALHSTLTLSHHYQERDYFQPDAKFLGNVFRADQVNTAQLSEKVTLSAGPSFRLEQANGHDASSFGAFVQGNYTEGPALFEAGVRVDRHSQIGSQLTYSLAPGIKLGSLGTTILARIGSAFKAPSIVQLYGPVNGNEGLAAERGLGREVSIEQRVGSDGLLTATYFNNTYDNLIQFGTPNSNLGAVTATGAELRAKYRLLQRYSLQSSYAYTDSRVETTGLRAPNRPLHSFRLAAKAEVTDKLETDVEYRSSSSRISSHAITFQPTETAPFDVTDLTLAYAFNEATKLSATIENIFDRRYQEVAGYGTHGRSYFIGGSAEF